MLLPAETNDPDFEAFRPLNHRALAALGMGTGLSHMEWFKRPDGSYAISEVGARPPGAQIMPLMSIAHDTDMHAQWVNLIINHQFSPPTRKYAVGAAFLRAQGHGTRIKAVHGLDRVRAELGDLVVDGWQNGETRVNVQPRTSAGNPPPPTKATALSSSATPTPAPSATPSKRSCRGCASNSVDPKPRKPTSRAARKGVFRQENTLPDTWNPSRRAEIGSPETQNPSRWHKNRIQLTQNPDRQPCTPLLGI